MIYVLCIHILCIHICILVVQCSEGLYASLAGLVINNHVEHKVKIKIIKPNFIIN